MSKCSGSLKNFIPKTIFQMKFFKFHLHKTHQPYKRIAWINYNKKWVIYQFIYPTINLQGRETRHKKIFIIKKKKNSFIPLTSKHILWSITINQWPTIPDNVLSSSSRFVITLNGIIFDNIFFIYRSLRQQRIFHLFLQFETHVKISVRAYISIYFTKGMKGQCIIYAFIRRSFIFC